MGFYEISRMRRKLNDVKGSEDTVLLLSHPSQSRSLLRVTPRFYINATSNALFIC